MPSEWCTRCVLRGKCVMMAFLSYLGHHLVGFLNEFFSVGVGRIGGVLRVCIGHLVIWSIGNLVHGVRVVSIQ